MAEWKYEVELKQYTPMMHFQPGQAGATLRATEVKPKLDRFLLWLRDPKKLRQAKTGAEERAALWQLAGDWALPSVHKKADPALCYKMRICGEPKERKEVKNLGAYFSIKSGSHKQVICKPITLTILCFQNELMKEIQKVLPMFFAVHNFGFRQNKGFGSFEVISEDKKVKDRKALVQEFVKIINDGAEKPTVQLYQIGSKQFNESEWPVLDMIAFFHQQIKSGINLQKRTPPGKKAGQYDASELLKRYIPQKYPAWVNEKKVMKLMMQRSGQLDIQKLLHDKKELGGKDLEVSNLQKKYVRGVLGFAKQYTFRNIKWKGRKAQTEKFSVVFQLSGKGAAKVQRFSSPLYFLPLYQKNGPNPECLILASSRLLKRVQAEQMKFDLKFLKINPSRDSEVKKEDIQALTKNIEPQTLTFPNEFDLFDFFDYLLNPKKFSSSSQINRQYSLQKIE